MKDLDCYSASFSALVVVTLAVTHILAQPVSVTASGRLPRATNVVPMIFTEPQLPNISDIPPLPVENQGVCPYECCRYDDGWQATAAVPVRAARNATLAPLFELQPGQPFTALTGVVVTTAAARVKLVRPDWVTVWDPVKKRNMAFPGNPGDVVFLLAYHGEGLYDVWFKGKAIRTVDGGGFMRAHECAELRAKFPDSGCSGEFIDDNKIETQWWVQLRDARRRVGWALVTRDAIKTPACR